MNVLGEQVGYGEQVFHVQTSILQRLLRQGATGPEIIIASHTGLDGILHGEVLLGYGGKLLQKGFEADGKSLRHASDRSQHAESNLGVNDGPERDAKLVVQGVRVVSTVVHDLVYVAVLEQLAEAALLKHERCMRGMRGNEVEDVDVMRRGQLQQAQTARPRQRHALAVDGDALEGGEVVHGCGALGDGGDVVERRRLCAVVGGGGGGCRCSGGGAARLVARVALRGVVMLALRVVGRMRGGAPLGERDVRRLGDLVARRGHDACRRCCCCGGGGGCGGAICGRGRLCYCVCAPRAWRNESSREKRPEWRTSLCWLPRAPRRGAHALAAAAATWRGAHEP
ncbi:hypothetical protein FGB62_3g017 [Gracilaria domingensis]|nr:hypothetical protein FGB62_3g017 [Gracilaria domingensis]